MEGVDRGRAALMCLLLDSRDTRISDIPDIRRHYVMATPNRGVTSDQVLSTHPARGVQVTVDEYKATETREAVVAHDTDKLECLSPVVAYRGERYTLIQNWIDPLLAALRTMSAKALTEAELSGASVDSQRNVRP